MFFPGVRPLGCLALGKLAEEVVGVFAMKVVGKKLRRAVVGHDALEEHQHRVVEPQMIQAVCHRKHCPPFGPRQTAKQVNDLVLGLGIQPAGHFIAEEHGGLAGKFHRQRQAALLTT